jgi:hypothetical protein
MALSKEISNEIIEVVGEYKIISVKKSYNSTRR